MNEHDVAGIAAGVRVNQVRHPETGRVKKVEEAGFQDELDRCGLKLSRHAQDRMRRRGIELGKPEMARLEKAVDRVESRGGKSSLVLMGELAFVVNVTARQVVTACSQDRLREGVFTNIDSTVIVSEGQEDAGRPSF